MESIEKGGIEIRQKSCRRRRWNEERATFTPHGNNFQ